MPDAQTMNALLTSYGVSGASGTGGGFNWANLIAGFLFSTIGFSVFLYGKKTQKISPKAVGIALMVYPYFLGSNTFLVYLVGILLIAVLFFWKD